MFENPLDINLMVPERIRINIFEHIRSHLNLAELKGSQLGDFEITDVVVSALNTKYHFFVGYKHVVKGTSSIIAGVPPTEDKETYFWYRGVLKETMLPNQQYPLFDFEMTKVGESE